jgi:PAS domain S-box-containing protein
MVYSIKAKILLPALATVLVMTLALAPPSYLVSRDVIVDKDREKAGLMAEMLAERVRRDLQYLSSALSEMARSERLDRFVATRNPHLLLERFQEYRETFRSMAYVNPRGIREYLYEQNRVDQVEADVNADPLLREAMAKPGTVARALTPDGSSGPAIALAVFRKTFFDEPLGALRVEAPLEAITGPISKFAVGKTGHALLVDADGTVLSARTPQGGLARLEATDDGGREVLNAGPAGRTTFGLVYLAGEESLVAAAPVGVWDWAVLVVLPFRTEIAGALDRLGWIMAAIAATAMVAVAVIAFLRSRALARPIVRLTQAVKAVGRGDLAQEVPVERNGDEITTLSDSFNRMTRDLSRFQAELVAAKEYNEKIIDCMTEALFTVGPEGRIRTTNRTARNLLGYSAAELEGLPMAALFAPGDPVATLFDPKAMPRWIEHGGMAAVDKDLLAKSGGHIPVLFSVAVQAGDQGLAALVCLALDITEHKRAQALLRAKEAAEGANKAKNEFLANMSHELRTPLNGLLGMLHLLDESPLNEDQKVLLETATESGRSLLTIITDILNLSQIEAGRIRILREATDLRAIVDAIDRFFRFDTMHRNVTLTCKVEPTVPARVLCDPGRLRQVLLNLVGNSFKYTEQGRIEVLVQTLPYSPRPGECVLLFTVSDTGAGIPADKIGTIFEPFVQVDGTLTRRHQGLGIGLNIVRKLVRLMDGTISVDSEEGAGTTMCFTVRCLVPGPATTGWEDILPPPPVDLRGLKVLLVEDDQVNRLVATRFLEGFGCGVVVAQDGTQAVDILAKADIDCVLMDIQMPKRDGIETTRSIRNSTVLGAKSQVPIIAMTAHAMPGDREKFLAAGMNGYVSKPMQPQELFLELSRAVSGWGRGRDRSGDDAGPHGAEAGKKPEQAAAPLAADMDDRFDRGYIERVFNGRRAVLEELLGILRRESIPNFLADIQEALDSGELALAAETAHKAKGSCGTVGAARAARLALVAQRAAKAGDRQAFAEAARRLSEELAALGDILRESGAWPMPGEGRT